MGGGGRRGGGGGGRKKDVFSMKGLVLSKSSGVDAVVVSYLLPWKGLD